MENLLIIIMEFDHHTVVHMLGSATTGLPASCTKYLDPAWISSASGQAAINTSDGSIVLVGAKDCLGDFGAYVQKATTSGTTFTGAGKGIMQSYYNNLFTYTDGYALVSQLSWPANPGGGAAGSSGGLCVSQDGAFSSCWSVTATSTANGYDGNKGYLIPSASIVTANDLVSTTSPGLGAYSLTYAD